MTALILEKIKRIKNDTVALLLSMFVSVHSLVWLVCFFVIPFVRFSSDIKCFFLIVWVYCSIQFFLEIIIDTYQKRYKPSDENKKNKVVFWTIRVSVLLCWITTFFLVFLKNNFNAKLPVWIIIVFFFFAMFTVAIIASLLSTYKDSYRELFKDLLKTVLIMLALVAITIGVLLNREETLIISQIFISIGAIPLSFWGLKFAIQKIMMSKNSKNSQTETIVSAISLFLIIGIVCAIFIGFVIKDQQFQAVLATIVGAVLGGTITLAGVAWTIKDSNNKRAEDLQRIENERKEEERKKHIPYMSKSLSQNVSNYVCVTKVKWLNFDKPEDVAKIKNESYFAIKIEDFLVKNISTSNIIVEGIHIDDSYYKFEFETLLEINGVLCVRFPSNTWYEFAEKISHIGLQVGDILGNHYIISCECSQNLQGVPVKETATNGLEYKVYSYTYSVESLSLPKLLQGEENE